MIEIIDYAPQYANDFRELNLEWLNKYNLAESHDLQILDDPNKTILENGGCIFLAKEDDKIVGTAALIKEHDDVYELAKMAVAPAFQGKGISKLLLEKCIATAKKWNALKILLFSNSQLKPALSLYEKFGFKYIDVTDTPFVTADIKMQLSLRPQ